MEGMRADLELMRAEATVNGRLTREQFVQTTEILGRLADGMEKLSRIVERVIRIVEADRDGHQER